MSALKQYGLLKGDAKTNYSADTLAKRIAAAPAEELVPLYREAILKPTIFRKLFDTFHGDTVSKAKLKQRAADLKVHPDETATCVELYVGGMTTAGLVTVEGDQVTHLASIDVAARPSSVESASTEIGTAGEDYADEVPPAAAEDIDTSNGEKQRDTSNGAEAKPQTTEDLSAKGPRAVFNVNVTLDSSLDIEKLQKQLELLKRFGAI